jgi:hypothetical protein
MIDLRKANFKDKQLTCIDCESIFTFTKGEQYFFASKEGLVQPKRCPECRKKRKLTLASREVRDG